MAHAPVFIDSYRQIVIRLKSMERNDPLQLFDVSEGPARILSLSLLNESEKDVIVEFGRSTLLSFPDFTFHFEASSEKPETLWRLRKVKGSFKKELLKRGDRILLGKGLEVSENRGTHHVMRVGHQQIFIKSEEGFKEERNVKGPIRTFETYWSIKLLKRAGFDSPVQNGLDSDQLPFLKDEKETPLILSSPLWVRLPQNREGNQGDVLIQGVLGDY